MYNSCLRERVLRLRQERDIFFCARVNETGEQEVVVQEDGGAEKW